METLKAIVDHLDELLQPGDFEDYGPNGLCTSSPAATTPPRLRRRLGELLAERFGLEHHFVEIANPI